MTKLLTFDKALAHAQKQTDKQHVLLGNGFSIACRPDCFLYGALLDDADFSSASTDVRKIFTIVDSADFERIIDLLRTSAALVEHYSSKNKALADRLRRDADVVRDALAKVLASKHPDRPYDIADREYQAARGFLAQFERIYTLNYDMLLYWSVMQDLEPTCPRNDGFGAPDDPDAPYVEWSPYATFSAQRVFYLHGGLHLYDSGTTLETTFGTVATLGDILEVRQGERPEPSRTGEYDFAVVTRQGRVQPKGRQTVAYRPSQMWVVREGDIVVSGIDLVNAAIGSPAPIRTGSS